MSFAEQLRGFGLAGIAAMLLILLTGNVFVGPMIVLPVGAALVLVWVAASATPWRDVGYVRPRSWMAAIAIGTLGGVALKLAMKAVVMPMLGADPVNRPYHFLAGNRAMLPAAVWAMLAAGFGEETVFRGYLFERGRRLLGSGTAAKVAIVFITSAWFGAAHFVGQGWAGVAQATVVGLVLGGIYAVTGRLFTLMIAHAAFDLTALFLIYYSLEERVAHVL